MFYWIRRSAAKGNLSAIKLIWMRWQVTGPEEVVFWFHKGVEFGHPWCADKLAWGYRCGMYGLPMDPVMEAKYRAIAKDLKMKQEGRSD